MKFKILNSNNFISHSILNNTENGVIINLIRNMFSFVKCMVKVNPCKMNNFNSIFRSKRMRYFEILIPLVLIQSTVLGKDKKNPMNNYVLFNTSVLTQKLYMYKSYLICIVQEVYQNRSKNSEPRIFQS